MAQRRRSGSSPGDDIEKHARVPAMSTVLQVGDKLSGRCVGYFCHTLPGLATVVAVGRDWVVVRGEDGEAHTAVCRPESLLPYRVTVPSPRNLSLYLWEDVLCDYTCGVAFAIAESEEEALRLVEASYGLTIFYSGEGYHSPKIIPLDQPFGFAISGGG